MAHVVTFLELVMCIYVAVGLDSFYFFENPKNFVSVLLFLNWEKSYFAVKQLYDLLRLGLSVAEQSLYIHWSIKHANMFHLRLSYLIRQLLCYRIALCMLVQTSFYLTDVHLHPQVKH
jgi:hypothetical protein